MKLSVITVCFNEEKNIAMTINSVLRQSSTDYEYIVCDGKSMDRTVEIAESFRRAFEEKGIDYIVKSEKDGGIYYGMNNGIDLASGDYVGFINAGDCLHGTEAIKTVIDARESQENPPDVIYGDATYVERDYYDVRKARAIETIDKGIPFFHPSSLVKASLIKEHKFDTTFKICADSDMMAKLYTLGKRFFYVDAVLSDFYAGGISTVRQKDARKESFVIRDRYGFAYNKRKLEKQTAKSEFMGKIKMKMPKFLWKIWCKKKKRRNAKELGNERII